MDWIVDQLSKVRLLHEECVRRLTEVRDPNRWRPDNVLTQHQSSLMDWLEDELRLTMDWLEDELRKLPAAHEGHKGVIPAESRRRRRQLEWKQQFG